MILKLLSSSNGDRLNSLIWGMLFFGVGIGILFGNILAGSKLLHDGDMAYPSMVFLFGGISLIVYYFLAGKLKK